MNHAEKIEDINALTQVLEMMKTEINRVRGQADQAKDYAPEAAETAYEKLDTAEAYWDESKERLTQAQAALESFLEYAKIARDTYDEATHNPNPKSESKAARNRERADRAYIKLENAISRTRSKIQKVDSYINKAQSRVKIALIKAQANEVKEDAKKVRINFTLPEYMKEDWQDMAEDLSTSVSAMIREAMSLYTSELKNAEGSLERGLTKFGAKMEQLGNKVEDFVENNIERRYDPETGELKGMKIKGQEVPLHPAGRFAGKAYRSSRGPAAPVPPTHINTPPEAPVPPANPISSNDSKNKERLKKRVTGLIKIQKSLPIPKLAQSLEMSDEEAENMIYELVAEGIEGTMKGDTFKFSSDIEEVIQAVHTIIDRL